MSKYHQQYKINQIITATNITMVKYVNPVALNNNANIIPNNNGEIMISSIIAISVIPNSSKSIIYSPV